MDRLIFESVSSEIKVYANIEKISSIKFRVFFTSVVIFIGF